MDKYHNRIEYLSLVQLEYISNLIRLLTYTRPEDVKKYGDICGMKTVKIKDVSFKEIVKNIFTSDSILKKYIHKIVENTGVPKLRYKNEEQKLRLEYWDKFYFFNKGTNVTYNGNKYVVDCNHVKTDTVEISNSNHSAVVPYSETKRDIGQEIIKYLAQL